MSLFNKNKDLYIYRLEIHGMRCGMCESHINNVIRQNFSVKKVKSSHLRKETIIYSKDELDIEKIKSVIASTGYDLVNITKEGD